MSRIILTILLLITIGCKAQIHNYLKEIDMKYFNENNFKDWEKDTSKLFSSETSIYLKRHNERMQILVGNETKQIVISEAKSPYTRIYRYNAKTNILFQESRRFYSIFIGKTNTYNEMGKLIKTQDWDAPYKISVEKLVKIVNDKIGIDLMEYSNQKNVNRYDGTGLITKPIYVIDVTLRKGWGRTITIDAITGEILFDKEFGEGGFEKYKSEIYQMKEVKPSTPSYRTHNGKSYTKEEWKIFLG